MNFFHKGLRAKLIFMSHFLALHIMWFLYVLGLIKKQKKSINDMLVVSLTSYNKRFPILHLTLKSLLVQSYCADKTILWVSDDDMKHLPLKVRSLERYGLEIRSCEDIKSYKKLIPTLKHYPDAVIVTADDDVYYWWNWLKELVDAHMRFGNKVVVCHRMHQITLNQYGVIDNYKNWHSEVVSDKPNKFFFPTGIGGVLYPVNIFHPQVLNQVCFSKICPSADDIWFYWMVRMNGGMSCKTLSNHSIYVWPESNLNALWLNNVLDGKNDIQIKAISSLYPIDFS